MKNYYGFIEKVLLSLGIEFEKRSKFQVPLKILRFSTPFFIFLGVIQSIMLLFPNGEKNEKFNVMPISAALFALQSLTKSVVVIYNQEKIRKVVAQLKDIFEKLDGKEREKSSVYLRRMNKICFNVFVLQMTSIWYYSSKPLISLAISLIKQTEIEKIIPYDLWWPFDPLDYYAWVLVYQLYAYHVLMAVQNIMDHYFMLVLAEIVSNFERLGERIKNVINESEKNSFMVTRINLRDCIVQHSHLLVMFDELNGFYELALLAQILSASLIICLVGYIILVTSHVIKICFNDSSCFRRWNCQL